MLDDGASSRIAASVFETKTLAPGVKCRYTTLSHRWGDGTMLKLEEHNINMFRRGIPIDQLSNLLKDAMYMTCQLDIEYIWIDCLCIIQGCKKDWELEARRMGDYYRYATCNISASGYEDSSLGLFTERMALTSVNYPIRPDFVLVVDEDGHEEETHYDGIYITANPADFDDIIHGPLGSRGWVAQERALSPSILHFTPAQMWWECTEHVVNEAFSTMSLPWYASQEFGAGAIRSINATSLPVDIYDAWQGFVWHYASTNLTFETDRFPAIIGIARIYDGFLHDNFLAGLWEGDLVRSLLWELDTKARRIQSAQIAPSWSWASLSLGHYSPFEGSPINGISFQALSDIPNFQSDLHTTTFEKSGVRGLAIKGPLRRISGKLDDLPRWKECATIVNTQQDMDDASSPPGQDTAGQEWRWKDHTHILPLWKREWFDRQVIVNGLLLQQGPEAKLGNTFRRLGTVKFIFHSDKSCDKYLGLVKENGNYKPSIDFEECGLQDLVLI